VAISPTLSDRRSSWARRVLVSLSELILPGGAGLSIGGPGRRMVFDGSKLGDLVMKGGLESRLKGVDLLSFDLGVER
jgi:hypothetical protein